LANTKQQRKRIRQNEKRRVKNSQVKSSIRTVAKGIIKLIDSKEKQDPATIEAGFQKFVKIVDTAAGKGVLKKNTAARKKSRLAAKVNAAVAKLKEIA